VPTDPPDKHLGILLGAGFDGIDGPEVLDLLFARVAIEVEAE
jgi:hypothetical protein